MSASGKKKQQTKVKKSSHAANKSNVKSVQKKKPQKVQTALQVAKSPQYTIANGVRKNIMVFCVADKLAVESIPAGILSRALSQGAQNNSSNQVYWSYIAFIKDLIALMSNQTSSVYGRLDYLNRILGSLIPKSVDGLKSKTIAYSWKNTDQITWQNVSINIRGKHIYWYVPGTGTDGVWIIQDPPSNPSTDEEANNSLSLLYSVIAADTATNSNLEYQPGIDLNKEYKKDVSCFSGVAPYYGQSAGDSSSSFGSAESEIPYKSQILSGVTTYSVGGDRVARFFHPTSGGTIEAFSLGLFPEMKADYYQSVYPVNYKYVDFDELYTFLVEWYAALTSKATYDFKNNTIQPDNTILKALTQFPFTAQQFALMVRQMLLSRFVCQTSVQANTYSTDIYGFEAFRCGSNCYPRQYDYTFALPSVMNENLSALLPRFFNVKTKYASHKNAYISMPVWGTFKNWVPANPIMETLDQYGTLGTSPMFAPPAPTDPNIWDGLNGNSNVCDLNRSPIIVEALTEWNLRISALLQYSSTVDFLGGESSGALLLHTRYCNYPPEPRRYLDTIFPMMRSSIPSDSIELEEVTPMVRTNSKNRIETPVTYRQVYIPKDGTLATQKTTAYASTAPITNAEKAIYSYLILPSIALEDTKPPYQRQARVAYVEPYVLDMTTDDVSVGGRYSQIKALASMCAPGTAGSQNSTLSQVVDYLTRKGKGGFIGDVLSVLAKEIPI